MAKEKCFYCGLPIYRTDSKVYTDTGEFAWKHSGPKSKKSGTWFTCAFALEEHGKTAINIKFYAHRASLEKNDYKREVEDCYKKNPILLMPSVTLLKTAQPNPHVCKHCGKSEDDPVAEVRVTIDIEGRKFKT